MEIQHVLVRYVANNVQMQHVVRVIAISQDWAQHIVRSSLERLHGKNIELSMEAVS